MIRTKLNVMETKVFRAFKLSAHKNG